MLGEVCTGVDTGADASAVGLAEGAWSHLHWRRLVETLQWSPLNRTIAYAWRRHDLGSQTVPQDRRRRVHGRRTTRPGRAWRPRLGRRVRRGGTGAVRLDDPLIEKKTSPLGIDVDRPRFSWTVESNRRGVEQESYRVRVSTRGPRPREVWDSGVVPSRESANVEYEGPPLRAATDYTWRVDVATTHGASTTTSDFRTGLYDGVPTGPAPSGSATSAARTRSPT